jgi:hypothetical protein
VAICSIMKSWPSACGVDARQLDGHVHAAPLGQRGRVACARVEQLAQRAPPR